MAPAPDQWPYPDVPSNETDFLADLEAFHAERGTTLDKEPKISTKNINLFKLFQLVEEKGGYDKCSAEKLMWRKLGGEFHLHQPAYAFQVKTVYYRNLAAYSIKKVHHQEPPPKEILEFVTARGGDIMTRTLENFKPFSSRELQDPEKEGSGDEGNQGTPKAEKMDVDDPASAGRSGRSLRQAPPPRQFFQPDTSSSRATRGAQPAASSPNPPPLANGTFTASSNPSSASFAVQGFEPNPPVPLTLRPVQTPRNNPKLFNDRIQRMRDAHRERLRKRDNIQRGLLLPGTGFDGPNIYTRITNAMRSGVPDEQAYALHHLIKISEVRGDRFRFDAFQGMAESLIQKTLEISSLFFDVQWDISYDIVAPTQVNILDGLRGTSDILQRLDRLPRRSLPGTLQPQDFAEILNRSSEAALVLRNMVLLEANSQHLAQLAPCRDMLSIVLNLPAIPEIIEIKHYMLDIAEQLTRYWPIRSNDPLFKSLMAWIKDGEDRGAILTSIRAICRIGYFMPDSIPLPILDRATLDQLQSWLLLEDDELVQACLEFFYEYTAVPANVLAFLEEECNESVRPAFLEQLARFVLHNAKEDIKARIIEPAVPRLRVEKLAEIPKSLLRDLVNHQETERSSLWLRSLFEEDPNANVTQLELWQAYQNTFTEFCPPTGSHALLAAADFIRNVSATFKSAEAKIDPPNEHRATPKFIIKGIKFRHTPVDLKQNPYSRCLWTDLAGQRTANGANEPQAPGLCGSYHHAGEEMFNHILVDHLKINRNPGADVTIEARTAVKDCHWARCRHFSKASSGNDSDPSAQQIMKHVLTHMPDTSENEPLHRKHNKTIPLNDPRAVYRHDKDMSGRNPNGYPTIHGSFAFEDTPTDEQGHPIGIAYWAVMILRNLARNVPRALAGTSKESKLAKAAMQNGVEQKAVGKEWMDRLFMDIEYHMWHVLAYNRVLKPHVLELLSFIEKGRVIPKE